MAHNTHLAVTEQRWQQICSNEAAADGQFFYAITTTRIFCRPSCHSRTPRRENVVLFGDTNQALAEGYRPCKRCKPTGSQVPAAEWTLQIQDYLRQNYRQPLTLNTIAADCHGSPYHLHRIFTQYTGCTPAQYLANVRLQNAKQMLQTTGFSIAQITEQIGMPNAAHFARLFKQHTGLTPTAYRKSKYRIKE